MNRNYNLPISKSYADAWGSSRETHPAVVMAIHALADSKRTAEAIWEDPTSAEWDHVTIAVQEYVTVGDFPTESDGRYSWGMEFIRLPND